jgi:hypothetical protein
MSKTYENLPMHWASNDRFGHGWKGQQPGDAWCDLFVRWLAKHYPDLRLVGDALVGTPATVGDIPRDGVYAEFCLAAADDSLGVAWGQTFHKESE